MGMMTQQSKQAMWILLMVILLSAVFCGAFVVLKDPLVYHVDLRDSNFAHHCQCRVAQWSDHHHCREGSSLCAPPQLMRWTRRTKIQDHTTVFTDQHLMEARDHPRAIAWLLEPMVHQPERYDWVAAHYQWFHTIWTHDREWMQKIPNAVWVPNAMTWIPLAHRRLYPKTRDVSFMASDKTGTPAYTLRHQIFNKIRGLHCFGTITGTFLAQRYRAFAPFRFTVVVENEVRRGYYSEKLIDACLTGCIPIYRGDHDTVFHVLPFDTLAELDNQLAKCTESYYEQHRDAVRANFERAQELVNTEDWIIKHLGTP